MPDAVLTPSGDQLPTHSLLAARGGCIFEAEVVEMMGLGDPSIVDRWRSHRQIISVRNEAGEWIYPVWQFARKHRRIMLGIRDCLAELSFESEWEPLIFFLSSMADLGGHSPLDCLRAGKIEAAIKAARQYSPLRSA
ncbi:MAG: hypothetical protein JO313_00895 [Verrucomicrobia bacterium]|nr:hypothetical protein [Verrucomicrobiota bacterium]